LANVMRYPRDAYGMVAHPWPLWQPFGNTKWPGPRSSSLSRCLLADLAAALIVGLALALLLAPIDLAMLRAGKPESPGALASLGEVFADCFLHPRSVVPAIAWTWLTFSGTYAMANGVRSCCTAWSLAPAVYVWLFTTVMQCVIMCLKDAFLTGGIAPPYEAVVVWVLRDLSFSLVVFVLPEPLSKWLISKGIKEVKGVPIQDLLQILLPQPLQLITSPLHFLGVSYVVARSQHLHLPFGYHLHAAFREFGLRVGIRCARVLVPYCFGAVANRRLRSYFTSSLLPTPALPTSISEHRQSLGRFHFWSFIKNSVLLATLAVMAQHGLRFTGPMAILVGASLAARSTNPAPPKTARVDINRGKPW